MAVGKVHRQLQALRIGLSYGQRVVAGVYRPHFCSRALVLQSQRNGAAAGAQIGQALAAAVAGQQLQCPIHQGFGVGARVQHAGVHGQLQPVKAFVACEIGHGLAVGAALQQLLPLLQLGAVQHIAVVCDQPGACVRRLAANVQEQHLCINTGQALRGRLGQRLRDVQSV